MQIPAQERTGACRSPFSFGKPVVFLLLFSLISLFPVTDRVLLLPPLILSSVFNLLAGLEVRRSWRAFLFLQPLFLAVAGLNALSDGQGSVFLRLGPVVFTREAVNGSILLYLKLANIFWITRVITIVWGRDILVDGLRFLFYPVKFLGGDPKLYATVLHDALLFFPVLLARLPRYLKRGVSGLADLLNSAPHRAPEDSPADIRIAGGARFHAIVYSFTLLSIFIVIHGGR